MKCEEGFGVENMKQPAEIDPCTGIRLKPGLLGQDCPGNGKHPEQECCCDECDHFLLCFPEWDFVGEGR